MISAELRNRVNTLVWETDPDSLPRYQTAALKLVRIFFAVARDFAGGLPTLRAMSLVYTTLLSLVPLIAVSFSVLKGFGVHNQIEPMLLQVLAPLGEQGVEITNQIIGFVNNIKVGVLGALGLGMLLYTVISLVKKIESAFNYTWRIKTARSMSESFTNYLSIIMVGPVLVFSAMAISASIRHSSLVVAIENIEPFGSLITMTGKLLPYLLIIAAFTFIYKLIPNTRVRMRSAFYGAVVAGILWETTGWLFATFVANSTNYTAVYSGFAIIIVFMIWLYLSWMILLTGSSIAYYHQHPERVSNRQLVLQLSSRLREKLALLVCRKIALDFHQHEQASTLDQLARYVDVSSEALAMVLDALEQAGIVIRTGENHDRYVPAQSIENISLQQVISSIRAAEESPYLNPNHLHSFTAVDQVTAALENASASELGDKTLKDLIDQD